MYKVSWKQIRDCLPLKHGLNTLILSTLGSIHDYF